MAPSFDPTSLVLKGSSYKEGQTYPVRGPLAEIVGKLQDYVASQPGFSKDFRISYKPLAMAVDAGRQALVIDGAWRLRQSLPFPIAGLPDEQTIGELHVRLAVRGTPRSSGRRTASDYDRITGYALGISFDSSISDGFDAGLVIQYQNPQGSRFSVSTLARQSLNELVDVQKVKGISFEGTNGGIFAGAIDLINVPRLDRDTFAFREQFPATWATTDFLA